MYMLCQSPEDSSAFYSAFEREEIQLALLVVFSFTNKMHGNHKCCQRVFAYEPVTTRMMNGWVDGP